MKKLLTLSFIIENNRILLAMKKRGFGAGRYNGYGGKVEEGETIEEGAKREFREESGLEVKRMEKVGIHEFEFAHDRGNILEVHVFHVTRYTGEAVETEEMKPEWFRLDAIPFENMWPDDVHWFPVFLDDKRFRTKFLFGENDTVLEKDIQVVEQL
ncbi:MAG: 8-oxo-dGTP diphosphatase [Candidatus Moranbacteria bacterium]|nr:8-oxo-dGTP diphosphatase [Candidatus Moranbacteria bacterium]